MIALDLYVGENSLANHLVHADPFGDDRGVCR
jgi:hypothetical protein